MHSVCIPSRLLRHRESEKCITFTFRTSSVYLFSQLRIYCSTSSVLHVCLASFRHLFTPFDANTYTNTHRRKNERSQLRFFSSLLVYDNKYDEACFESNIILTVLESQTRHSLTIDITSLSDIKQSENV